MNGHDATASEEPLAPDLLERLEGEFGRVRPALDAEIDGGYSP
jgi:hypothetical protein